MTQLLEICSVCRRVQDRDGIVFRTEKWGDLWTYIERSRLPISAVILSATYCPDCVESYRLLMAYGRADQVMEHEIV
jgi:hypothetical protein